MVIYVSAFVRLPCGPPLSLSGLTGGPSCCPQSWGKINPIKGRPPQRSGSHQGANIVYYMNIMLHISSYNTFILKFAKVQYKSMNSYVRDSINIKKLSHVESKEHTETASKAETGSEGAAATALGRGGGIGQTRTTAWWWRGRVGVCRCERVWGGEMIMEKIQ